MGTSTTMGSCANGSWSRTQILPTTGAGTPQNQSGISRDSHHCSPLGVIEVPPSLGSHSRVCDTPGSCPHTLCPPQSPGTGRDPSMIPIPFPGMAGFLPGCAAAVSEKGREETPGQRVTHQHPKVPNSHQHLQGHPGGTQTLGNGGDLLAVS